jgi:hypothetical protein
MRGEHENKNLETVFRRSKAEVSEKFNTLYYENFAIYTGHLTLLGQKIQEATLGWTYS